jgi:hypothetical protein
MDYFEWIIFEWKGGGRRHGAAAAGEEEDRAPGGEGARSETTAGRLWNYIKGPCLFIPPWGQIWSFHLSNYFFVSKK